MLIFTTQEQILLCIYDAGSRAGTLAQLRDMMVRVENAVA